MDQADYTNMYDLLKAIEDVISSANPEKRNTLAATLDKYMEDNPQEFFWVTGPQAPALLHTGVTSVSSRENRKVIINSCAALLTHCTNQSPLWVISGHR